MKLQAIELYRVELPLVRPFRTSFFTEYVKDTLLLRAIDADGNFGWGECVAATEPLYSHEFIDATVLVMRDHLLPRLKGELRAEDVPHRLEPVRSYPMAKGALELALLDLQLRAERFSFGTYLGSSRDSVECGVSVGIPVDNSMDSLLSEVSGYVDAGYRRIKLKIQPGWDFEPTRIVSETWPAMPLQVDANQAYDRNGIDVLAPLDAFSLLLIEQPLHEDDLLGHRMLADRMETPICLDESITSVSTAESAIEFGACEVVNIKAGRVGGYLAAKAIHDLCYARGIPVWCGGMVETGIGRAANVALSSLPGFVLPGDTSGSDRFFARDVTQPLTMAADGLMAVPDMPGLGVEPLADILDELTVWQETLNV